MTAGALLVAEISIVREIVDGRDEVDLIAAVDGNGNALDLVVALGMLRLAELHLIRNATGET